MTMTTTSSTGQAAQPRRSFTNVDEMFDAMGVGGATTKEAERSGEVRNAIEDTLSVFEGDPGATRALEYLGALLATNAEARAAEEWRERALKAEAALAGGANASIAKETHTGAGEGLVAGVAAGLLDGLKGFVAEVNASAAAWAAPAPAPSTVVSTLVVKIDTSAIDAALAKVAELKAALAGVLPVQGDRLVLS